VQIAGERAKGKRRFDPAAKGWLTGQYQSGDVSASDQIAFFESQDVYQGGSFRHATDQNPGADRGLGLCYQLGGDNISVLSAAISLPSDNNTDNSGPKEVLRGGAPWVYRSKPRCRSRVKGKRRFGPAAMGLVGYWAVSERMSSRVDAKDDDMENSALFAGPGAVRFDRTVSFLAGALSVDRWFAIPAAYPGLRCKALHAPIQWAT